MNRQFLKGFRYYFVLASRIFELTAICLFIHWAYAGWTRQPWYFTSLNLFAAATNGLSFFMAMRRNAAQYVYRVAKECPNCDSNTFFIEEVLQFRTSKRAQCVFIHCAMCDLTSVYSCKCTPERCDFRIACLAMPTIHVPFVPPR